MHTDIRTIIHHCTVALLLTVSFHVSSGAAAIFIPENAMIAVDTFRTIGPGKTTTFSIRRDVFDSIRVAGGGFHLQKKTAEVITSNPVGYDNFLLTTTEALFTCTGEPASTCAAVMVTDVAKHDLPVSTNFSIQRALNDPAHDGFVQGESDGLIHFRWDNSTGMAALVYDSLNDTAASSTLYYKKSWHPIGNDTVISYENYIGERFSVYSYTGEVSMAVANEILKATGFPVLFRNFSWKEYSFDDMFRSNFPGFQVINNIVYKDSHSLYSVVLPPWWNKASERRYPVVFSHHYDVNRNIYKMDNNYRASNILTIAKIAADVIDSSAVYQSNSPYRLPIGLFWNGGGNSGTVSLHESAIASAKTMFHSIATHLNADIDSMIAFGGSRGGNTPLYLAAENSDECGYKFFAIVANCPVATDFNILLRKSSLLTYPYIADFYSYATGCKYAWEQEYLSGRKTAEVVIENILGVTSPDDVYHKSLISSTKLKNIDKDSTRIILSFGTFDPYSPMALQYWFIDTLATHCTYWNATITHRYGHGGYSWAAPDAVYMAMCNRSLENSYRNSYGKTLHLTRDKKEIGVDSTRTFSPWTLEYPQFAVQNKTAQFVVTGCPSDSFRVRFYSAGTGGSNSTIFRGRTPVYTVSNEIPDSKWFCFEPLVGENPDFPVSVHLEDGRLIFHDSMNEITLEYKKQGDSQWVSVDNVSGVRNEKYGAALLYIARETPHVSSRILKYYLAQNSLSCGISEY